MRAVLVVAALTMYFACAAWPGIQSGFNHDDLMNLSFALHSGWRKVLLGNLAFFSTETRPLGALYYLGLYDLFGMTSLPFRVVGVGLVGLNIWLIYRLGRLVIGSAEAGLYAAVPLVWHGNLAPLFFGSGNIYDVLGFTFYVGALVFHASRRLRGPLSGRDLAVLSVLQICALNSKEFTASLPIVILAFELLFHLRHIDRKATALTILLSGIYTAGKVFGSDSLVSHPAYAPRLSFTAYLSSVQSFQNDFFYQTNWATPVTALWFLALLIGLSAVLRNRAMWFGCALTLLGPLPVMLISPRGLASHYLTVGGLALWFAALLDDVVRRFLNEVKAAHWERRYVPNAVFVALLAWHVLTHAGEVSFQSGAFWNSGRPIAEGVASMKQHPEWWSRRDARILVVADPYGESDWASIFMGRLVARNRNLQIDNLVRLKPPPPTEDLRQYDLFLRWDGHGFVATTAP